MNSVSKIWNMLITDVGRIKTQCDAQWNMDTGTADMWQMPKILQQGEASDIQNIPEHL